MFGKVVSCETTAILYHFYIPQFGKCSCFSLFLLGGLVHMTWKTSVFLNDSSWKQTIVACAKYWSDPGKRWPAVGCSEWKLYKVQTALWSGFITSCLIWESKNQRSAFQGESRTVLLCFSFVCFVLNSSLCTCSFSSCWITNTLLIPNFFVQVEKNALLKQVALRDAAQGASPTDMTSVLSCEVSFLLSTTHSCGEQTQWSGIAGQVTTKTWPQRLSVESAAHS